MSGRTKFKVAPPPEQDDGSDSDDDLGVEVYELSANLDAEEPALPSFQRERCMPEPWMEYSAPKEREAFRARQRVAMGQASTVRPEREPPKGVNLARVFPNYGHAETKRAEYRAERESLDFILAAQAVEVAYRPLMAAFEATKTAEAATARLDACVAFLRSPPSNLACIDAGAALRAARRLKLPFEKLIIPPSATEQLRVFEVHQQRRRAYLAMLQAEVDRRSGKVEVEGDAKLAARRAKREAASAAVATKPKAAAPPPVPQQNRPSPKRGVLTFKSDGSYLPERPPPDFSYTRTAAFSIARPPRADGGTATTPRVPATLAPSEAGSTARPPAQGISLAEAGGRFRSR